MDFGAVFPTTQTGDGFVFGMDTMIDYSLGPSVRAEQAPAWASSAWSAARQSPEESKKES
jgi:hypothetical protein